MWSWHCVPPGARLPQPECLDNTFPKYRRARLVNSHFSLRCLEFERHPPRPPARQPSFLNSPRPHVPVFHSHSLPATVLPDLFFRRLPPAFAWMSRRGDLLVRPASREDLDIPPSSGKSTHAYFLVLRTSPVVSCLGAHFRCNL